MIITEIEAEIVSQQMVYSFFTETTKLREIYEKMVKEEYLKTIPKDIMEMFNKYKNDKESFYILSTNVINVVCEVINSYDTSVTLNEKLPCKTEHAPTLYIGLDQQHISSAFYNYKHSLDRTKKLKTELSRILKLLSSYQNIEQHLPEAMPFLLNMRDNNKTNILQCTIWELKEKLSNIKNSLFNYLIDNDKKSKL